MSNRKAKGTLKDVFKREGLNWNIVQEQAWNICVRYGYFEGAKTITNFLFYLQPCYSNRYLTDPEERALYRKYEKVPLVW